MQSRLILALTLLTLSLVVRPALADDDQDIRAALGPKVITFLVDGGWAMADVGDLDKGTVELKVLHRYKGAWMPVSTTGNQLTHTALLAYGMPDNVTRDFGLGDVPEETITALRKAMVGSGISHKTFNIVTAGPGFIAFTSPNDPRADGCQIWSGVGNKWTKQFVIEPKLTLAQIDAIFDKHHISRFLEYRTIVGRNDNS